MKIKPIYWILIGLIFLISGVFVIVVNKIVFTASWMIFWGILGTILFFIILKNRPEAKIFDNSGKEVDFEEAMTMANDYLGKKFYEYWSIDKQTKEGTIMAGEPPASPIYIKTGKGFWDSTKYYLFGVNGKHADKIITLQFKDFKPFTDEEIKKIANDLTEKPERLEVVKYGSERDEFTGIDKPTTTITRPTREQFAKQQAQEQRESMETLEGDVSIEGSE